MFKLVGVLLVILAIQGLATFIWAFFYYPPNGKKRIGFT
jgi:hypothetical protein